MVAKNRIAGALAALNHQVTELRACIAARKAERGDVAAAPLSAADAHRQVDGLVDHLAAPFSERFQAGWLFHEITAVQLQESIGLTTPLTGLESLGLSLVVRKAAPFDLVCWLLADQLRTRLHQEVETALASLTPGLPMDERPARIAELDAEILQLERDEEAIVSEAESIGFEIPRRGDADPRAVLDVTFNTDPAGA